MNNRCGGAWQWRREAGPAHGHGERRVTGSGDVVVTGSTQALNARVVGSGDVAAKDLEADRPGGSDRQW